MDNAALFVHLFGVALLIAAVSTTLLAMLRTQTARSVAELRILTAGTRYTQFAIIPAMVLIIGTGLYLVSRHGYHGSIPWSAGWVDTALVVTLLLSVIGATVEDSDARKLQAAVASASGERPDAELRQVQLSSRPVYVVFFSTSQVVAVLYLMTCRPGLAASIIVCAAAAAVSAAAASWRVRSIRQLRPSTESGTS
jgi:uncharacterized membrane protein